MKKAYKVNNIFNNDGLALNDLISNLLITFINNDLNIVNDGINL